MRGLRAGVPVTLEDLSQDWTQDSLASGVDTAHGRWRIRPGGLFFTLGNLPTLLGVSGTTGSFVYYVEAWDAVIAGTFDQTRWEQEDVTYLMSDVLPVLARLQLLP